MALGTDLALGREPPIPMQPPSSANQFLTMNEEEEEERRRKKKKKREGRKKKKREKRKKRRKISPLDVHTGIRHVPPMHDTSVIADRPAPGLPLQPAALESQP